MASAHYDLEPSARFADLVAPILERHFARLDEIDSSVKLLMQTVDGHTESHAAIVQLLESVMARLSEQHQAIGIGVREEGPQGKSLMDRLVALEVAVDNLAGSRLNNAVETAHTNASADIHSRSLPVLPQAVSSDVPTCQSHPVDALHVNEAYSSQTAILPQVPMKSNSVPPPPRIRNKRSSVTPNSVPQNPNGLGSNAIVPVQGSPMSTPDPAPPEKSNEDPIQFASTSQNPDPTPPSVSVETLATQGDSIPEQYNTLADALDYFGGLNPTPALSADSQAQPDICLPDLSGAAAWATPLVTSINGNNSQRFIWRNEPAGPSASAFEPGPFVLPDPNVDLGASTSVWSSRPASIPVAGPSSSKKPRAKRVKREHVDGETIEPKASKSRKRASESFTAGSESPAKRVRPPPGEWPRGSGRDERFQYTFIGCDNCKCWVHYGCAGIETAEEAKQTYICPPCQAASTSEYIRRIGMVHDLSKCARPDCLHKDATKQKASARGEPEYAVEKIVGRKPRSASKHGAKSKRFYWLIKWEGYTHVWCEWLPEENMGCSDELINRFDSEAKRDGYDELLRDQGATIILNEVKRGGFEG